MKLNFYILCFFSLFPALYAQQRNSESGMYEGTFMEQKCALSLKISNGAVIGSLYTGRNTSHSIIGTFENGQLIGLIHHKVFEDSEITGSFTEDKLIADVILMDKVIPLQLTRKSKSTEINFDKFFGKPNLDFNLVGSWKVISNIDYKDNSKSNHSKMHCSKDGGIRFDGMELKGKTAPDWRWYTSDQHLYVDIRPNGQSMEIDFGEYKINNDTLTLLGVGKFKGGKTVYVKEH